MEMTTERPLLDFSFEELVTETRLTIRLSEGEVPRKDLELRVLCPTPLAVARCCREFLEELDDEESSLWFMAMMQLHLNHSRLDPRRTRQLSLCSVKRYEALREQAKLVDSSDGPVTAEHLVKLSGDDLGDRHELLRQALYERPDIRLEVSSDDYEDFRDLLLGDLLSMRVDCERRKEEIFQEERERVETDETLSDEERREALSTLATALEEAEERLTELFDRIMRRMVSESMEEEEKRSAEFVDLVGECRKLQDAVCRHMETLVSLEPSESACRQAGLQCVQAIREHLDMIDANDLIWKVVLRFEEVYGVTPIRGAEILDVSDGEVEALLEALDYDDEEDEETCRSREYLAFQRAHASGEILDKWNILTWFSTRFANRNECVRLAVREAEDVCHKAQAWGFKRILRLIRHDLTKEERRAFLLLCSRLSVFGNRIAALDPVIMSFFNGMDEETRVIVVLVLVFRIREWEGRRLDEELERRWLAYLRLYPLWTEIIRFEDRERRLRRESPLSSDIGAEDTLLQALMREGDDVESWSTKYCTPEEARCVMRCLIDGWSQEQIAKAEGISQQAVSRRLSRGREKIRRGLAAAAS